MNKILSSAVIAGCMAVAGLAACTSQKQAPATIADLTGEWNIIDLDGQPVQIPEHQDAPYIAFDTQNGQISGNASCNAIMGSFDPKAAPGVIDLSHIGATRMMCPDMQLEDRILKALSKVDAYRKANNGYIELCHSDTVVMKLQKRESSISAADLEGSWKISEINGLSLAADTTATDYTMTFNPIDNTFSCETGCNAISGSYSSETTDISFNNVCRTAMMCPDMEVEDSISSVLPKISSFGMLAGGGAGFYDGDQNLLLLLER